MTGQLSRVHRTVTRDLLAKVEAAQHVLAHAHPDATIADILELGADTALAQDARRKGLVKKPRPPRAETPPASPDSDHIPAHIRRAVWEPSAPPRSIVRERTQRSIHPQAEPGHGASRP